MCEQIQTCLHLLAILQHPASTVSKQSTNFISLLHMHAVSVSHPCCSSIQQQYPTPDHPAYLQWFIRLQKPCNAAKSKSIMTKRGRHLREHGVMPGSWAEAGAWGRIASIRVVARCSKLRELRSLLMPSASHTGGGRWSS